MAPRIVSIDPGLKKVAYAVWSEDGTLLSAGLVIEDYDPGMERAEKWRKIADYVDLVTGLSNIGDSYLVIEIPQIYSGNRDNDPNDLIDLAGVVGAIVGKIVCGSVEWSPTPREWKGQLPKEISQKRVEERLSLEEKALIEWPIKSLRHNVYDALHLGLTYLEREGIRNA